MGVRFMLLFFLFLSSCQNQDLDENFRKEIIQYKKKVPLPSNEERYLYLVNFSQRGNDTLFTIIRSPGISKHDIVTGIYEDKSLLPLAIIDDAKLGINYYNTIKNENISDFVRTQVKEDFPPLFTYKVSNNKIKLVKIDTISDRWTK